MTTNLSKPPRSSLSNFFHDLVTVDFHQTDLKTGVRAATLLIIVTVLGLITLLIKWFVGAMLHLNNKRKTTKMRKGALEGRVDEDTNYEKQISFYKKNYPSLYDLQFLQENMFVILLPFSNQHKNMLAHCKQMLEHSDGTLSPILLRIWVEYADYYSNGRGTQSCRLELPLVPNL